MLCCQLCGGVKAAAGRRSRGAELFHRAVKQAHVAVEQVMLPRRQTPCLVHLVAQPHHSVGELGHLVQPKVKASSSSLSSSTQSWSRLNKQQQQFQEAGDADVGSKTTVVAGGGTCCRRRCLS
jgi:hypothetical protein